MKFNVCPLVGEALSETFEMNPDESSKRPRRILHTCSLYIKIIFCPAFYIVYSKESQTLGHGPVPVCGLLGMRPHRRRAGSKLSSICVYSRSRRWLTVPPPVRSVITWDSHRSLNSTIVHHLQMGQEGVTGDRLWVPTDSALQWVVQLFHYTWQCNNNRNKMHNKHNAFESSRNHAHPPLPEPPSYESSPWCQKVGDHCYIEFA